MQVIKISSVIIAIAFLISACSSNQDKTENISPKKEAATKQATEAISDQLPKTKEESMVIEGQKQTVINTLYNDPNLNFYTYYPAEDFKVEKLDSPQDGSKVRFNALKNDQVFLEIFFPPNPMTVEDLSKSLKADKGIIKRNNWKIIESRKEVSYPWVKEKITIGQQTQKAQNLLGDVLIGEHNGRAFYIIEHFPSEFTEGFGPRFHIILENMEFKS